MYKVCGYDRIYEVYGDFHTHTTYSGHAMCSPEEMVKGARKKGLEYIALTDHVYEYTERHDVENQKVRPKFFGQWLSGPQIRVIGGREMNLFTDNSARFAPGLNLCAWHSWFGPDPDHLLVDDILNSHKELSEDTHIMCHPERTAELFTGKAAHEILEAICHIAYHTQTELDRKCYIEINTTSGSATHYGAVVSVKQFEHQEYLMRLLEVKFPDLLITLGSDAHCTSDICHKFGFYLDRLRQHDLLDRVVNLNKDLCEDLVKLSNT